MASPIQRIVSTQLTAVASVLYASPPGTYTQIVKLTCVNTDSAGHVVTLYMIPSGGGASGTTETTLGKAILPGDTWNSPNEYGLVLNPGDALAGLADTGSVVNVFVSAVLAT